MRGALAKKKQNSAFSKFFCAPNFVFFLHELLQCRNAKKIARTLRTPASLMPNFLYIFFNFLAIFFEFTAHSVHFKVFRLTRAAGMSKLCQNLHAPCSLEYLRSHKISDFFEFFCYFFRIYCSPFTIHQTVKPL